MVLLYIKIRGDEKFFNSCCKKDTYDIKVFKSHNDDGEDWI